MSPSVLRERGVSPFLAAPVAPKICLESRECGVSPFPALVWRVAFSVALRLHFDARQRPNIDGGARLHSQAGRHNRLCAASAAGPAGSSRRFLVVPPLRHVLQGHADARHALAAASDKGFLGAGRGPRASLASRRVRSLVKAQQVMPRVQDSNLPFMK